MFKNDCYTSLWWATIALPIVISYEVLQLNHFCNPRRSLNLKKTFKP